MLSSASLRLCRWVKSSHGAMVNSPCHSSNLWPSSPLFSKKAILGMGYEIAFLFGGPQQSTVSTVQAFFVLAGFQCTSLPGKKWLSPHQSKAWEAKLAKSPSWIKLRPASGNSPLTVAEDFGRVGSNGKDSLNQ